MSFVSKLSAEQWAEARALYEAGTTAKAIAQQFGVDRSSIRRHAQREGWRRPRKTKHAAQPAASSTDPVQSPVAAVLKRHREEVHAARERLYAGIRAHKEALTREHKQLAFEDLKAAKISAETLMLLQRMERLSWGLDQVGEKPEIVIERNY
jgi:uncharacterized protein YjcR